MTPPLISVIIPTFERAYLLKETLLSLTTQTLPHKMFEVLVIDNGSTDNTCEIVQAFSATLPNIRYFFEREPGLHAGRHRGLKEAKSDILTYADDDIEAFPTWLSSIAQAFDHSGVVMAGGNNIPKFIESPPEWLMDLWERPHKIGGKALPPLSILEINRPMSVFSPSYVWGCNFSIRRSTLLEAGGFHPDGMPQHLIRFRGDGETHVSKYVTKTGQKCVFHPDATVYHKVTPDRMTFGYFRKRGFNQGISDSYSYLRNREQSSLLLHIFRRFYKLFSRLKKCISNDSSLPHKFDPALREFEIGHQEGYNYHQRQFQLDPELRAWVLRSNYFIGATE